MFKWHDAIAVQTIPFPALAGGRGAGPRGDVAAHSPPLPGLRSHPGGGGEDGGFGRACFADGHAHDGEGFDAGAFLVGPENQLVQTVTEAVVEFAERRPRQGDPPARWLNPLVIVGPCGSGKSHLAHGLASIVAAAAGADEVLVTTAADFAAQYSAAVADDSLETMRARIRRARMWVIEDLAHLPERRGVQAEFLNRVDETLEGNAWVVVTAPRMPGQLTNLLAATRSRLDAGLILPLASPGLEVRREFLRRQSAACGLPLEPQQIDEIARRLPASVRQLQGAIQRTKLARLSGARAHSEIDQEGIAAGGMDNVKSGLEETLAVTSRYFGVSQAALKSASRAHSLVHARSVAMYLARELAGCTLQEIGQALGGRDHTTVLHACRKIDRSASHDAALQEELADLRRLLLTT